MSKKRKTNGAKGGGFLIDLRGEVRGGHADTGGIKKKNGVPIKAGP